MLIYTEPCLGCEEVATFSVQPADYLAWVTGRRHIQDCFPCLNDGERVWLNSRLCPDCWEETLPPEDEEDEEDDYEEWLFDVHGESVLDPESDYPEYESDYYVDRDCD